MSTDSFGSVLQYRSISLMRALTTSGSCLGCFAGFEGLAAAAPDDPAASDRTAMPSSISNATPTAASRPDRARPRTVRRAEVESWEGTSSGRHAQTYDTRVQSKIHSPANGGARADRSLARRQPSARCVDQSVEHTPS